MTTATHAYPEHIIQRVIELHQAGHSRSVVAEKMGWGREGKGRVCGIIHRLRGKGFNLEVRGTPTQLQRPREITPEMTLKIIGMLRAGRSARGVAHDLGISDETVARIRTINNIPVYQQQKKPKQTLQQPRPKVTIQSPFQNVLLFPSVPRMPPAASIPKPRSTVKPPQCEWLDGDAKPWVRCCEPAVDRVWCEAHRKRVFTKRNDGEAA